MFVTVWEVRVRSGHETEFERAYGAEGDWERLFRRGNGFIKTELLRDADDGERFVTIDRWVSKSAYETFRDEFAREYAAIDERCEALTLSETKIGDFETSL